MTRSYQDHCTHRRELSGGSSPAGSSDSLARGARAMTGRCKGSGRGNRAVVRPRCLSCVVVVAPQATEAPDQPAPFATEDPPVMIKRILLALGLAASLGGAVVACNTPASTTNPSVAAPPSVEASTPASSTGSSPAASEAPSTAPSAS